MDVVELAHPPNGSSAAPLADAGAYTPAIPTDLDDRRSPMKPHRPYRAIAFTLVAALLATGAVLAHEPEEEHDENAAMQSPGTQAAKTFEQLKALDGTWTGTLGEQQGTHVFRVSAAGSVVMETMGPGTGYEMINMYHLDGDDLVLTHYCAAGNQPTMRLAGVSEDGRTLRFEFTGGSNLDPAVDDHIHEASLTLVDDDTLEESWVGYADGKPAGEALEFTLHRAE
jgi:hypothetical protein